MGDDVDRAQRATEVYQDAAMRTFRARQAGSLQATAARDCRDCGLPIPEARRKANPAAERCIFCQIKFERGDGLDE